MLSKCKFIKFINLIDFNDETQKNIILDVEEEKNYANIIIMDYISQGDDLSHITKILDYLELSNNEDTLNKYYKSNIQIINKIKKQIDIDEKLNTDPITDEEFNEDENKITLNGNFLNLYNFINISSIYILNKELINQNMLIKLLILSYIYKDIYSKILLKYEEKLKNRTNI